ncbi:MAG: tRNA pseudouridine(38-40) synthase TruA, partial [Anaerolineae bacterium]
MVQAKAVLAYDGTRYAGFQRQAGVATVQGEIERALKAVTQEAASTVGAGRTDAGVHATGQVMSFASGWSRSWEELQGALNARLPDDIAVISLASSGEGFHARKSAISREYTYTLYTEPVRAPMQRLYALHHRGELDAERMAEAAQGLVGRHDFSAFGRSPSGGSTLRTVRRVECRREGSLLRIVIEADAFLRRMARRIIAALIPVGEGKAGPGTVEEILRGGDPDRIKGTA